jgi:hypothetical protein
MSEKYRALIAEWRKASDETRAMQQRIKARFDAHLAGTGAPPSDADLDRLHELRQVEQHRLEEAMRYIKDTALGPPTGFRSP